jgi:hypothetical protein
MFEQQDLHISKKMVRGISSDTILLTVRLGKNHSL